MLKGYKTKGIKAIYDAGCKWADRYTVYYSDRRGWGFLNERNAQGKNIYPCVGMSASPFHPQGVGQHGSGVLGRHNGKRIDFKDLPRDCQALVLGDLKT